MTDDRNVFFFEMSADQLLLLLGKNGRNASARLWMLRV